MKTIKFLITATALAIVAIANAVETQNGSNPYHCRKGNDIDYK